MIRARRGFLRPGATLSLTHATVHERLKAGKTARGWAIPAAHIFTTPRIGAHGGMLGTMPLPSGSLARVRARVMSV